MNYTDFKDPGSIEKPGPIGRMIRIFFGIFCFYFLYVVIIGYDEIFRADFPADFTFWLGVLLCLKSIHHVFNIGFGFHWGKWPQRIYLVLGFGAVVFSYVQNGTFWGPEVGVVVFGLLFLVLVTLAPSMILSGIIATPG